MVTVILIPATRHCTCHPGGNHSSRLTFLGWLIECLIDRPQPFLHFAMVTLALQAFAIQRWLNSHFQMPPPLQCQVWIRIRVRIFFKFVNPTPLQTVATIDATEIQQCCWLGDGIDEDHTDSCYCIAENKSDSASGECVTESLTVPGFVICSAYHTKIHRCLIFSFVQSVWGREDTFSNFLVHLNLDIKVKQQSDFTTK